MAKQTKLEQEVSDRYEGLGPGPTLRSHWLTRETTPVAFMMETTPLADTP